MPWAVLCHSAYLFVQFLSEIIVFLQHTSSMFAREGPVALGGLFFARAAAVVLLAVLIASTTRVEASCAEWLTTPCAVRNTLALNG